MNSQAKIQAAKLILENIQMFDDASRFINEELSLKLFGEIDKTVQTILKQKGKWNGTFNFYEDGLYFYPNDWKINDNSSNLLAKYYLDSTEDINFWWVTNLFGTNSERMAFFFKIYYGREEFNFPNKTRKINFKKFALSNVKEMQDLGFKFDTDKLEWYLPIPSLDVQQVIDGLENNELSNAMDPIRDTMEKLLDAHQYFEQIVEDAKNGSFDE